MFLMLTYHFQVVLGFTPVQAGLAFLPLSVAVSGERLRPRQPAAPPRRARGC